MSAVSFVQGGSATFNYAQNIVTGLVLPGDATPGDAVVLFVLSGGAIAGVSAGFGEVGIFDGGGLDQAGSPWVCADVTTSADTATVVTSADGWHGGSLEFSANGGIGYASAGYANLNGSSNFVSGNGSIASATVENPTPGAAYVVYAIATGGGNYIASAPGSPWTPYTSLVNILGIGAAWLIAENTDAIQVSFETSDTSWAMWLIEILPPVAPPYEGPFGISVALSQAQATVTLS